MSSQPSTKRFTNEPPSEQHNTDNPLQMSQNLSINKWAIEDRPREKLMQRGADALTSAELLAILIGSGSARESAVDLMKRILADCNNNLNTLGKKSIHELMKYNGVGEAKAISILAACELGKRRQREQAEKRLEMLSSQSIYEFMLPLLQDKDVEEAWVLLLNQSCKLIKTEAISHGGISETAVDVRIIMREALLNNATNIVLCHNHPSNNARPSRDDDSLTARVKSACQTMRIRLLDHLIITDGTYYSYNDEGKL